jgi:hypothetical protein
MPGGNGFTNYGSALFLVGGFGEASLDPNLFIDRQLPNPFIFFDISTVAVTGSARVNTNDALVRVRNEELTPGSGRVRLTYSFTPFSSAVPEPATWTMMLIGFGAIGHTMRRARRRSRPQSGSVIRILP